MSTPIVDRVESLEQTLAGQAQKLIEYDKGQARVLDTLEKIHGALLGQLDKTSPGLIDEIRTLKKDSEQVKAIIERMCNDVNNLQVEFKIIKESKLKPLSSLSRTVERLKKWKYTLGGAFIVIGFLLGKIIEFLLSTYGVKILHIFKP